MNAWRDHSGSIKSRLKGKTPAKDIIEIPDDDEPKRDAEMTGLGVNGKHDSVAYPSPRDCRKLLSHRLLLRQEHQRNGVMHKENVIDLENAPTKRLTTPIVIDSDDLAKEPVLTYDRENMLPAGPSKSKNDNGDPQISPFSGNNNIFHPELYQKDVGESLDAPLVPVENRQTPTENPVNYIAHNKAKRQKNYHVSPVPFPVAKFGKLLLGNQHTPSPDLQEAGSSAKGNAKGLAEEMFSIDLDQGATEYNLDAEIQEDSGSENPSSEQAKIQSVSQVETVFPGISWDYVSDLWDNSVIKTAEALIETILEKGTYPKEKDVEKDLKRKRAIDPDEEAAKTYNAADRSVPASLDRRKVMRSLLSHEFPATPISFISTTLQQSGYRLFPAYQKLDEAERTYDSNNPPYLRIRRPRKADPQLRDSELNQSINKEYTEDQRRETLVEFQLARKLKRKAEDERRAKHETQLAEEANALEAAARGEMGECGCCFGDYPLNRMVHCDSDTIIHWFCRGCAKQNADTVIGQSKYQLRCMSMDDCSAGFNMEQRSKFLDRNTVIALDRNEQEAVLRLAGIENLASCPFCPYAAEYPPVEINKEFRCQAPDCEKVSCRICKLESHIPLSCEEFQKKNGLSIRRQIEEAMSAAMIRKCNKCGTPFIKEEGCNKMTCTRNGCHNIQCYVCHKSCTYNHFNDPSRGGKPGNCPLFENVEDRHNSEVTKAEKEALEKVREAHPEFSEQDLKIHLSERVKEDEDKRRARRGINGYVQHAQNQARLLIQQHQAVHNWMAPFNPAGNMPQVNNADGVLANHGLPHQMPALEPIHAPAMWQAPQPALQQHPGPVPLQQPPALHQRAVFPPPEIDYYEGWLENGGVVGQGFYSEERPPPGYFRF